MNKKYRVLQQFLTMNRRWLSTATDDFNELMELDSKSESEGWTTGTRDELRGKLEDPNDSTKGKLNEIMSSRPKMSEAAAVIQKQDDDAEAARIAAEEAARIAAEEEEEPA